MSWKAQAHNASMACALHITFLLPLSQEAIPTPAPEQDTDSHIPKHQEFLCSLWLKGLTQSSCVGLQRSDDLSRFCSKSLNFLTRRLHIRLRHIYLQARPRTPMLPLQVIPRRLEDKMYVPRLPTRVGPKTHVHLIRFQNGPDRGGCPAQ